MKELIQIIFAERDGMNIICEAHKFNSTTPFIEVLMVDELLLEQCGNNISLYESSNPRSIHINKSKILYWTKVEMPQLKGETNENKNN